MQLEVSRYIALAALTVALVAVVSDEAAAQSPPSAQSRTILVDEGGSYDVLVHPSFVTVFYLPDKIQKAISSDNKGYEVLPVGSTSLAIRPLSANVSPANLALATDSIKVSVVLRVAQDPNDAMTQVTFKRADVEAEVQRRIEAGVKERTTQLEARITELQRTMDAELPKVAEGLIASRLLQRRESRKLNAIERNAENIVVEATEVHFLGEDAYVVFAIENRRRSPYRLAAVRVQDGSTDRAGLVRFTSDASETAGKGVIGVVPAGGKGKGVVTVRRSGDVIGKTLELVITEPGGRGKVVVDRIVLR